MAASLSEMMQNLCITEYHVGSEHWVHATHITDPGNFYVRPAAHRDYLLILKKYQGPVDPSQLQLGSTVVYKSKTRKHHLRGQVRNIKTENDATVYDLFALDYGFTELSVPLDRLKKPLDDSPVPALVLHCQLSDCNPKKKEFDEDAIEAMIYFAGTDRIKMTILGKTGDKYIVQINILPEDLATLLAITGYTYYGYGNNSISRMPAIAQPKLFYNYKQLKIGDTLRVRLQSGNSLKEFYTADINEYRYYTKELTYVKEYYKVEDEFSPENLKCGTPLAVFYDRFSRYERALISEVIIPEKKAVVQLVDWGTKLNIHVDTHHLRAMTREPHFVMPALALYCQADETQIWDNNFHKFLYPGYEFTITVKKVGHQHETPSVVTISN